MGTAELAQALVKSLGFELTDVHAVKVAADGFRTLSCEVETRDGVETLAVSY